MDKQTLIKLLAYKRWADTATLEAIKRIDPASSAKEHHLMLRLMNHIYVVDRIFRANMAGRPHGYQALNTPETPTAEALITAFRESTDEYIAFITTLSEDEFGKVIRFTFVDGGEGEMRLMDMVNHILFHGTYHRGAVGWLIQSSGGVAPKDVLTVFLRDSQS